MFHSLLNYTTGKLSDTSTHAGWQDSFHLFIINSKTSISVKDEYYIRAKLKHLSKPNGETGSKRAPLNQTQHQKSPQKALVKNNTSLTMPA